MDTPGAGLLPSSHFGHVGLDWERFVEVDPRYFRPTEVDALVADASRRRSRLGWEPSVSFPELVTSMVEADLAKAGDRIGGRAGVRPRGGPDPCLTTDSGACGVAATAASWAPP